MASCSIPNSAGSILFPFESEKYMEETIFSCGTISWYSPAFQPSCPSGALMQKRNFPPTRKSISQKGARTLLYEVHARKTRRAGHGQLPAAYRVRHQVYSYRRATMGSMREARRA